MKRFTFSLILLVLLLSGILAASVSAQEATPLPEAPSDTTVLLPPDQVTIIRDENPVLVTVIAVLVVVIAVFGSAILYLAHKGFNAMPEWVKELVLANGPYVEGQLDSGFNELDRLTQLTPNTLDDILVKYGRDWVLKRTHEFFDDPPSIRNVTQTPSISPTGIPNTQL